MIAIKSLEALNEFSEVTKCSIIMRGGSHCDVQFQNYLAVEFAEELDGILPTDIDDNGDQEPRFIITYTPEKLRAFANSLLNIADVMEEGLQR